MDIILNVHGYAQVVMNHVPYNLEEYLRAELEPFVHASDQDPPLENVVAEIDFVAEADLPDRKTSNITLGPSLSADTRSSHTSAGLFWFVDKYGAATCLDLGQSSSERWSLMASRNVIPSNFTEYVLRGWILRTHLLRRGVSFVHASAVAYHGHGIIFPGWGGTGKTNLVFKLLAQGAMYMGDDLALLSDQGQVLAYPERVNIFDYNIKNLPNLKRAVPHKSRFLFGAKHLAETFYNKVGSHLPTESGARAFLKRLTDLAYPLGATPISVTRLFPEASTVMQAPLTHVFHLFRSSRQSTSAPGKVEVEEVESIEAMATRMAACLRYEHAYCDPIYDAFLFAFPEYHRHSLVDDFFEVQCSIFAEACRQARCWYVGVPAQSSARDLCDIVISLLSDSP